jgi:AcrR family transcriptional regulator
MRQQRPRGTITRESIVAAALAVADGSGVHRLTIRAIAQRVGAPPMSLYTHFKNKDELLDLMYAEVARRMYAYQGQATWQAELLALGHRIRSLLTEHPKWAPLLSRPVAPLNVTLREEVLKLMVKDGIIPTEALLGLSAVALTSIGLVLVSLTLNGQDGESFVEQRFARLKDWVKTPAGQGSVQTNAALQKLGRFELDGVFQFHIHALIAGLEAKRAP